MNVRFDQLPRMIGRVDDPVPGEIRHLPQFYRADLDMAWRLGGPFFRQVIGQLSFISRWKYTSVDSRTSMLMRGQYPCIPGWHCDDFYRPNGQPDIEHVMEKAPSEHVSVVLGTCSRTVFVDSVWEWDPRPPGNTGETVYGNAHLAIEAKIKKDDDLRLLTVLPGELCWFGPLTWHRGSPATENGWRHFMRITGSNHLVPQNELRTQTQVYLTHPFAGW